MKIIVVHNAKSGSAVPLDQLRQMFERHDVTIERAIAISPSIKQDLEPYLDSDTYIAAVGGDGTVSAVAGIIQNTKATLIPLPGGTLNHFTKDLGINQDLETAIADIKDAKPKLIDIAEVNDLPFINNSSIGLYPSSLQTRKHIEDSFGKWPAAIISMVRAFVLYRTYEVTLDGTTFHTPFIFVGNNNYNLDKPGTGRKQLDKGELSVYALHARSRWALVKVIVHARIKRLKEYEAFYLNTAESVTIVTHRDQLSVSHDGELSRLATPLKYKILKKKLRIIGSS